MRAFTLSAVDQTSVHDNFIYVGPGIDLQILAVTNWDGWANGAVFRHNTFWVMGSATYGHMVRQHADGIYELAAGWGPAQNIKFEGNRYIGLHRNRPEDPHAVVERSGQPPELDWNEPTFDLEHFDAYMAAHRKWMIRLFEQEFGTSVKLGA